MKRLSLSTIAVGLMMTAAASAADLCPEAEQLLSENAPLAAATRTALGDYKFVAKDAAFDTQCIAPVELLSFKGARALVTVRHSVMAGHGEPGTISVHVIGAKNGKPALLKAYPDIAELGTWGDPGEIKPAAFDGADAFTAESGGTFQGVTFADLNLFVLRGDQIVRPEPIMLYGDDSGAEEDPKKQTTVEGAFQVGKPKANQIAVTYKITAKGKRSTAKAVFALDGDKWKVVSGKPPLDLLEALR